MDYHTIKLNAAAERLGIAVRDLSPQWGGQDAVEYRWEGQRQIVFDGISFPYLLENSRRMVDDKTICKAALRDVGVRVPEDLAFEASAPDLPEQLKSFMVPGQKYVAKPVNGADGDGVAMHLDTPGAVLTHLQVGPRGDYAHWLLEEQVPGEDIRMQAIGGKMIAACKRIPATFTGDGQRTLGELVEAHNAKIYQQNPNNKLRIDSESQKLMAEQSVALDTVLTPDQVVVLKYIPNMGMGGIAIDITEEIHPDYFEIMARVAEHFKLRTFAMDGLTVDFRLPPGDQFCAIEINGRAQWMHHTFSEVRTHDMPVLLLKDLFGME